MKFKFFATGGALLFACGLCCAAPLLALFGVGSLSSLGLGAEFGLEAGLGALALVVAALWFWRVRTKTCRNALSCSCAAGTGCKA